MNISLERQALKEKAPGSSFGRGKHKNVWKEDLQKKKKQIKTNTFWYRAMYSTKVIGEYKHTKYQLLAFYETKTVGRNQLLRRATSVFPRQG